MELQGRTLGTLESLSQKHILWVRGRGLEGETKGPPRAPEGFLNLPLAQLTARLEDLENQLATQK